MMDYEDVVDKTREARGQGVDIICLDDMEWQETKECLTKRAELYSFKPGDPMRPARDTFRFMGVEFIKEE